MTARWMDSGVVNGKVAMTTWLGAGKEKILKPYFWNRLICSSDGFASPSLRIRPMAKRHFSGDTWLGWTDRRHQNKREAEDWPKPQPAERGARIPTRNRVNAMAQHDQAHQTRCPLLTKTDPYQNCPHFSQSKLTAQWGGHCSAPWREEGLAAKKN